MSKHQTPGPDFMLDKLRWLLDYELAGASRYRRFASLAVLRSKTPESTDARLVNDQIRACDKLFELEGALAILMSDTDKTDADVALKRIHNRFRETFDFEYTIVSYPDDGIQSADLILTAFERIGLNAKPRE